MVSICAGIFSDLISFLAVCETVGGVHRSRGGWCRGVAKILSVTFLWSFRVVGWDRRVFYRYGSVFFRGGIVRFKFQVGLAVGVR